jgi:hypothetical protein
MFAPGDRVVVLPPFGDGATPKVVLQVQHVTEAGEIVAQPAATVQYVLADHPLPEGVELEHAEGCAFSANLVEAAP